nr:hypothetical protein CFP56_23846 [Quercus suber]
MLETNQAPQIAGRLTISDRMACPVLYVRYIIRSSRRLKLDAVERVGGALSANPADVRETDKGLSRRVEETILKGQLVDGGV